MAILGRRVRLCVLPQTVESVAPLDAAMYIAAERIGGMKSLGELKQGAYVYVRDIDPPTVLKELSVTSGTRTETIQYSPLAGGIVNGWRTQDTGIDVQWQNYADFTGRGISGAVFLHDEVNDTSNPTLGGSYHGNFNGTGCGNLTYGTGFSDSDVMQGSHPVSTVISGNSYSITAYPLEWNLDGDCAEGSQALDHNGTAHDPIIWPTIKMTHTIELMWDNNPGIHKCTGTMVMPVDLPANMRCAWVPIGNHGVFGFDDVIAYDTDTTTYTPMVGTVAYTGLASPSLADVSASDPVVTITFSATHGRTVATRHNITITGASGGGASINGTHDAFFDTSTTCTFNVSGASGSYTGASVTSPTIHLADLDESLLRQGLSDTLRILKGAVITNDEQGGFPGKQPFTGGRCAVILRATNVETWSIDDDFAVGWYCERLSTNSVLEDARRIAWKSARGAGTPTSGVRDGETILLQYIREWTATRANPMLAGTYSQNVYILTGTYAQVQASITTLDAETDGALW